MDKQRLLAAVRARRISRRDFIATTSAMGLSAATASALFAKEAAAADPKKGGRLSVAMIAGGQSDTFEQTKMTSTPDAVRAWGCYSGLARVNRQMEPEPMLAEEWDAKPGAAEWSFKLREGVEFHNGKSFEAEDVVDSISRHVAPDSESPAKPLWEDLDEIKADGKHRVTVKLKSGNALLPMTFAADYHSTIHPAGHEDFSKPVGTGPYKVQSFEPGQRTVFERFENYWREDVCHLDEVEILVIPDATSRVNALLSGDLHVIESVDTKIVGRLASTPGIDVISTPSASFRIFCMMCDRAPTDNLDVRLALKYACNRQQMVDVVFKGHATIGNDTPVAPTMAEFCSDVPQRPYDPEKAAFHWKKAGMEGQTLELHTAETAGVGSIDMATLLSESARAANMDLKVIRRPEDGYWSETWMKFPVNASGWNARPTADLILSIAHKSDAPWNETAWQNADFDKLLLEGRVELDPARRREIYCELQRLLNEEGGALIPLFPNFLDAKSATVQGWEPHPAFALLAGEFFETAWLDV